MRRLLTRTLLLTVLLTLVTGTTLLVARAQPPSARVAMLHLDDCQLPCWIRITPGKTTIGEAKRRLQEVFGDSLVFTLDNARQHWTDVLITLPDSSRRFNVSIGDGQPRNNTMESSIVTAIAIYPNGTYPGNEQTSIGELYPVLGSPTYEVVIAEGTSCPRSILYADFRLEIELDVSKCDAQHRSRSVVMPVVVMTLYQNMFSPPNYVLQWRGFGRF